MRENLFVCAAQFLKGSKNNQTSKGEIQATKRECHFPGRDGWRELET